MRAVKTMLSMAIRACRKHGKYVGICGQGPSDHPDLARWLMEQGIDSMSLNPDTVVSTWMSLAEAPAAKSQRPRRSRCFSRFHSRSRSTARLSCLSLPRPRPTSSLMPLAVVQVERHERIAALLDLSDQALDLLRAQEELPRADRIGLDMRRRRSERADIRADEVDLPPRTMT